MTSEVGISNISFINFQDDDQAASASSPTDDVIRSGKKLLKFCLKCLDQKAYFIEGFFLGFF